MANRVLSPDSLKNLPPYNMHQRLNLQTLLSPRSFCLSARSTEPVASSQITTREGAEEKLYVMNNVVSFRCLLHMAFSVIATRATKSEYKKNID